MAYVAVSQSLRDAVRGLIDSKREKETRLIPKPNASAQVRGDDPDYLQAVWKEHMSLMPMLPRAWLGEVDSGAMRASHDHTLPNGEVISMRSTVSLSFSPRMYVPPKHSVYSVHIEVSPDHPLMVDVVAYDKQVRDINDRWQKVEADVLRFLDGCKSLNEALKLWPDIRIYVPTQYLHKAEEKTAKAKAAESKAMEILKEIDVDHAVSSAVMVRMLEANKQEAA